MDALPSVKRGDSAVQANHNAAVVNLNAQGDATVGKFVAPLPTDSASQCRGCRSPDAGAPGRACRAGSRFRMPLTETNPYFRDLLLCQYEIVNVKGVVFAIGYWADGVDDLLAALVDTRPTRSRIQKRTTMQSARRCWQRFRTTGLRLSRRADAFPQPG